MTIEPSRPRPSYRRARRLTPAIAGAALFAVMALLYLAGAAKAYRAILKIWGIKPWPFAFLDTDTVLSAVRCLRGGVDVYVANPCDPLGRPFDYSPLWMALTAFPVTLPALPWFGLGVDAAFLATLALLPGGRRWGDTALITAGVLSTAAVFAVERGNNDLVLFVLAALAATAMLARPGWRIAGYGAALLAGLLKYYPMLLMALAVRERPARLFTLAAASVVLLGLFVALTWHDLVRALALVPTGSFFEDMFGAITVGGGLTQALALPPASAGVIRWSMTLTALAIALEMGGRRPLARTLQRLTVRERSFLFAGSLLILGCFFTAQNIGYRAVHLILLLPALTALRREGSFTFAALPFVALALLWAEFWRHGLLYFALPFGAGAQSGLGWAVWLAREALWWWLATVLLASVIALVINSEAARLLRARFLPNWPVTTRL
jgi:hypothetical protein